MYPMQRNRYTIYQSLPLDGWFLCSTRSADSRRHGKSDEPTKKDCKIIVFRCLLCSPAPRRLRGNERRINLSSAEIGVQRISGDGGHGDCVE